jgi:hypothetical protein
MEMSIQIHAPAALPHREGAPGIHWIGGWPGEPQSMSGRCGGRRGLALPGIEPGPSSP